MNDVWHGVKGVPLDDAQAATSTFEKNPKEADKGTYKKNITEIVNKAEAAGVKTVILTATVIKEDLNSPENQKLAPYNDFLRQLAKEKHLALADLNAAVTNGTFRPDLLYRLNVFPIEMPPLRERKDDILMLVEYFVQRYARRTGRNIRSVDQKTLDLLQSYDWPGNIRELQNVIERSIILNSADVFSIDEMWLSKRIPPEAPRAERPLDLNVEPRSEREIIEAALAESRGRVSGPSGAAAKLGIPPSTLETRIKALKINKTLRLRTNCFW